MTERELIQWAVKVIEQNIPAGAPHTGRKEFLEVAQKYLADTEPVPAPPLTVVFLTPKADTEVAPPPQVGDGQEWPVHLLPTMDVILASQPKPKKARSAANTARVISRLLRKHQFPMARMTGRYYSTEGFYVNRVGRSNVVNVSYHVADSYTWNTNEAKRQEVHGLKARVRQLLEEQGYQFEKETGFVICETK